MTKEFETAKRVASEQVTIPFTIKGDPYEYHIIATDPPAGVFFDIALMVEGTPVERLASIARILDSTLTEESAIHFAERIRTRDPVRRLGIEDAVEIVSWVIGEISGRPTLPSSASSNGELPTGEPSTDPSLDEAPTL